MLSICTSVAVDASKRVSDDDNLLPQGSLVRCTSNKLDPDTLFTFEQWRGGGSSTKDGIRVTDLIFIRSRVGDYLCTASHGPPGVGGIDESDASQALKATRVKQARFLPR